MALNKAYDQYKQNSIYTSTPEELTLMLYNGLIKFIMLAQGSLEERDIEKIHNSIIRAEEIVVYLRSTLDMKYEIAQNLDALYEYMYSRLVQANIKKDKETLEEMLGMAKELRDTWTQAMKQAKLHVNLQRPQQVDRVEQE